MVIGILQLIILYVAMLAIFKNLVHIFVCIYSKKLILNISLSNEMYHQYLYMIPFTNGFNVSLPLGYDQQYINDQNSLKEE